MMDFWRQGSAGGVGVGGSACGLSARVRRGCLMLRFGVI